MKKVPILIACAIGFTTLIYAYPSSLKSDSEVWIEETSSEFSGGNFDIETEGNPFEETTRGALSSIPSYQLASTQSGIATLTDGASFQGTQHSSFQIDTWSPGDMIELLPAPDEFSAPCTFKNGQRICPYINLKNIDKERTALAKFSIAPDNGSPGSFIITGIDMGLRQITLDDSSVWQYEANGTNYITLWHVGDQVMIGRNPVGMSRYDAFFFNTTYPNTLFVLEQ